MGLPTTAAAAEPGPRLVAVEPQGTELAAQPAEPTLAAEATVPPPVAPTPPGMPTMPLSGFPPMLPAPGYYPPPYGHPFPPHYGYPFPPPTAPDQAGLPLGYPYPHPFPFAYYPPPPYPGAMPQPTPPQVLADRSAQAHNQQLLISGIIAAVLLIHLPWLIYLFGVHGCWGSFVEACRVAASDGADFDSTTETQMLFARVAYFMLRVQTVLSVDFAKFSEVLQLSTGLGSFALTKIVAANGMVATGNLRRFSLAGTCAVAFVVLFWAELHLTGSATYAVLGDETVLAYIDANLPPDFLGATAAKAGLMQYLQILRLADALIFGAALAMPRAPKGV